MQDFLEGLLRGNTRSLEYSSYRDVFRNHIGPILGCIGVYRHHTGMYMEI